MVCYLLVDRLTEEVGNFQYHVSYFDVDDQDWFGVGFHSQKLTLLSCTGILQFFKPDNDLYLVLKGNGLPSKLVLVPDKDLNMVFVIILIPAQVFLFI